MMLRRQPAGSLSRAVECLWYSRRETIDHRRERALPSGGVTIVIHLSGDPMRIFSDEGDTTGQSFGESAVWGPQSRFAIMDTARKGSVVGIHFRPGAAMPFLNVGMNELTDLHVTLEDLWGPPARRLRELLSEAHSPELSLALLEHHLAARLVRPRFMHPAVAYALREMTLQPAVSRITDIQRETGYSPKRFIELFAEAVGLTPKLYSRLQRFQTVLWSLTRGHAVEWARVAADCGYYDQPHLNRDFRTFSGVTPGAYRPVSKDRPHHVAISE